MAIRILLSNSPPLKAFFLFGSSIKIASYLINRAISNHNRAKTANSYSEDTQIFKNYRTIIQSTQAAYFCETGNKFNA